MTFLRFSEMLAFIVGPPSRLSKSRSRHLLVGYQIFCREIPGLDCTCMMEDMFVEEEGKKYLYENRGGCTTSVPAHYLSWNRKKVSRHEGLALEV
jgi:hypothetical protein